MDSLTQLVTGAAVGEVIPGKKTGNKAIYTFTLVLLQVHCLTWM